MSKTTAEDDFRIDVYFELAKKGNSTEQTANMILKKAEQYAKAKVLEALEEEVKGLEKRREHLSDVRVHIKPFVRTAKLKEVDRMIKTLRKRS